MPEHMHFIINPQDGDVIRFLSQLKPAITQRVVEIATERQNHRVLTWLYDVQLNRNRLWQDGKYNFHLYTDRLIWQKINYIHTNPIARRLTKTADEYPYSSYRAMYNIENKEIIIPIDRDHWWEEDD
jgi:REP element-mobilizing transposase RayT